MDPATLDPTSLVRFGGAALLASIAAVMDFRVWRIPNWLTVPGFVLGLVVWTGLAGFAGFKASLLGFAFGFGILFVLFALGGGGGGDVKLLGAVGAWLGWSATFVAFVGSAVIVAVIEIVAALFRWLGKSPGKRKEATFTTLTGRARTGRGVVPYAVPLALMLWIMFAVKILKSW